MNGDRKKKGKGEGNRKEKDERESVYCINLVPSILASDLTRTVMLAVPNRKGQNPLYVTHARLSLRQYCNVTHPQNSRSAYGWSNISIVFIVLALYHPEKNRLS